MGVLYWSMNIPGQVAMRQGLEEEARQMNKALNGHSIKLLPRVAGDGEGGIEKQIQQMHELLVLQVDAIIIQPTDNAALAAPLRAANKAGVPVVAYDQYISGGRLAAYRTSDNYQAGYLDGEYILDKFPPDKEIRLILVEYPHVSSTVERVNGFLDGLHTSGRRSKILKSYFAVEPVSGQKAGRDILRDFPQPGSVDVVFTVNDGGGLSVVEALAAAGRKEIMVATIDGDPASVDNIRSGRLTVVDCAQFCGPLGAEAMKATFALLNGQQPPYHALVPVFPITMETLHLYPGWLGPIPTDFKKAGKVRHRSGRDSSGLFVINARSKSMPFSSPPSRSSQHRKLALSFGAVVLLLMLTLSSTAGYLFTQLHEKEEDRLASMLAIIFAESIGKVSFSGKYHARLFVEEIQSRLPALAFISVETQEGKILAHSQPEKNDTHLKEREDARLRELSLQKNLVLSVEHLHEGQVIKEVVLPFRSELDKQIVGAVRIGIKMEEVRKEQRATVIRIIILIVLLTLIAMGALCCSVTISAVPTMPLPPNFGGL